MLVPRSRLARSFSWSLAGGVSTGVGMLAVNTIVARSFGPSGLGLLALTLIVSQLLAAMVAAGVDLAAARGVARGSSDLERRRIGGTAFAISIGLAVLAMVAGGVAAANDVRVMHLPLDAVVWIAATGAALGLRSVAERVTAGWTRFRAQAVIKSFESGGMILITLAAVALGLDWRAGALGVGASAALATCAYVALLGHQRLLAKPGLTHARSLVAFARYALVSTISMFMLTYADKLWFADVASRPEYGQYVALYSGSVMIAAQLVLVAQNVLLPAFAAEPTMSRLVRRLDRFALLVAPGAWIAFGVGLGVVLAIFGSAFHAPLSTILLFALWATILFVNVFYATMVISRSPRAMAAESRFMLIRVATMVVGFVALDATHHTTLIALTLLMFGVELMEAVNLRLLIRRYVVGA